MSGADTRPDHRSLSGKLRHLRPAIEIDRGEDYLARQVFDLPVPVPLVVTEHRAHRCRCAACGTQTRAEFPEAVSAPVQYGARIAAFVVYLMNYQFVPEDRLATLMADLFGVSLSRATIGQMSRRAARAPARLCRSGARADPQRTRQASRRDRVSHRRAHEVAAYRGHSVADVLSRLAQAG